MNPEQLLKEFIAHNQNIDEEKAKRIINEKFFIINFKASSRSR